MAYDEALAARIEQQLAGRDGISQRKMFGGVCYMLHGNMAVGVTGDELMLRLGEAGVNAALTEPHTRPMDFTGRVLKNMVYVAPAGCSTDKQLAKWIERALEFAGSLPRK
jgi:TfoX/Sxy family transcriptional regulator of competence genes